MGRQGRLHHDQESARAHERRCEDCQTMSTDIDKQSHVAELTGQSRQTETRIAVAQQALHS